MILPQVISINLSKGGIPKLPVKSIWVMFNGLEGDGHNHDKHCTPLQAVSLQDIEKLQDLNNEGYSLVPGSTGENLTLRGINVNELPVGALLHFANGVILELTKVRKPCYVLDAIDIRLKTDIVGRCGLYAKVIKEGRLVQGESVSIVSLDSPSNPIQGGKVYGRV